MQKIRYYEQIGLLPKPRRNAGNQLVFPARTLSDEPAQYCEEVDRIAQEHPLEVKSKIERPRSLKTTLKKMMSDCAGNHIANCRIVRALCDQALCLTDDHLH